MCSRKQIDLLFEKGNNALSFPIKLIYLETDVAVVNPCQALFVVPKRIFKKAHDRNRIKRRMKEAYRHYKPVFYSKLVNSNKKIICAFVFVGQEDTVYKEIAKAVTLLINRIKIE